MTDYLREALELARQGRALASPNPMVGAVLVREGEVVGRGFHTWAGMKHAEILALEQAGERARGAALYINLEPCCHVGRTGPCTEALIAAGVKKVVAAMRDPNPLVAGEGFQRLRAAGVEVEIAAEFSAEAEKLNEPFAHFMRTGRPLVTLKAAVTLDGKISAPDDNLGWITSETARAHVQQLRHDSDAILTGIGTVLTDNPLLTDRSGLPRRRPLLRLVLDSQLRLPLDSRMLASARADLRSVIHWLAAEKYLSLMIEAGSKMNWSALEAEVVDKIFFYYGPKILGGMQSLPVAGGIGRRRRADAIVVRHVQLHAVAPDEFAVEGYIQK